MWNIANSSHNPIDAIIEKFTALPVSFLECRAKSRLGICPCIKFQCVAPLSRSGNVVKSLARINNKRGRPSFGPSIQARSPKCVKSPYTSHVIDFALDSRRWNALDENYLRHKNFTVFPAVAGCGDVRATLWSMFETGDEHAFVLPWSVWRPTQSIAGRNRRDSFALWESTLVV